MEAYTVSLFGHREIDDLRQLEKQLIPIIKELIRTKYYLVFLIGRNGEFDEYAASVIRRARSEVGTESSELCLVLPYSVSNIEFYEKYYDSIIIPQSVFGAHPKSCIGLKNRWMIEQSELVIVYVKHNRGGAYTAMSYAEKMGKTVINLCTDEAILPRDS